MKRHPNEETQSHVAVRGVPLRASEDTDASEDRLIATTTQNMNTAGETMNLSRPHRPRAATKRKAMSATPVPL